MALVCAQERAGKLNGKRGRTDNERREQHVRYALGRAESAVQTLATYQVVALQHRWNDALRKLDEAVSWFHVGDASRAHKNASPAKSVGDTSWLSDEAKRIVREEILIDDYAVFNRFNR